MYFDLYVTEAEKQSVLFVLPSTPSSFGCWEEVGLVLCQKESIIKVTREDGKELTTFRLSAVILYGILVLGFISLDSTRKISRMGAVPRLSMTTGRAWICT